MNLFPILMISTSITAVGHRIRRLRESKGYSRNDLAHEIDVDVSSIAGWEGGKRLPRANIRARLAHALDCDLPYLMSSEVETETPTTVNLLDVGTEFPQALNAAICNLRRSFRGVRLAAPGPTTQHVLRDARLMLQERILAGSIEVQCVEIYYSLSRLKEALSNILRYDGKPFYAMASCIGLREVAPFLGGNIFDQQEVMLGAYSGAMPPQGYSVLHLRGPMVRTFFDTHWTVIWSHGTLLNPHGAHDLSAVRKVACQLGLPPRQWRRFVEEARALDIGDGAPPLV